MCNHCSGVTPEYVNEIVVSEALEEVSCEFFIIGIEAFKQDGSCRSRGKAFTMDWRVDAVTSAQHEIWWLLICQQYHCFSDFCLPRVARTKISNHISSQSLVLGSVCHQVCDWNVRWAFINHHSRYLICSVVMFFSQPGTSVGCTDYPLDCTCPHPQKSAKLPTELRA